MKVWAEDSRQSHCPRPSQPPWIARPKAHTCHLLWSFRSRGRGQRPVDQSGWQQASFELLSSPKPSAAAGRGMGGNPAATGHGYSEGRSVEKGSPSHGPRIINYERLEEGQQQRLRQGKDVSFKRMPSERHLRRLSGYDEFSMYTHVNHAVYMNHGTLIFPRLPLESSELCFDFWKA